MTIATLIPRSLSPQWYCVHSMEPDNEYSHAYFDSIEGASEHWFKKSTDCDSIYSSICDVEFDEVKVDKADAVTGLGALQLGRLGHAALFSSVSTPVFMTALAVFIWYGATQSSVVSACLDAANVRMEQINTDLAAE